MTFTTTVTSKGQMTIPAAFRKQLGIKPGEQVIVNMSDGKVTIEKNNWRENLSKVQAMNMAHLKKHGIKPLTDEELDNEINRAAEAEATQNYLRKMEK